VDAALCGPDQGFEDFPLDVLLLPNLQELRLRNDGLSVLPPEIGALKKLSLTSPSPWPHPHQQNHPPWLEAQRMKTHEEFAGSGGLFASRFPRN
jgi:hypothetical protein